MCIKSLDNKRIKEASALLSTSGRRKNSAFILEGKKLIDEALSCGYAMLDCFVLESESVKYIEYNATAVTEQVFAKITETENPQGISAVFSFKTPVEKGNNKVVILENIQDPGNFGTIIRTSEAFGIDMICVIGSCPDRYSGKVMRASMGSALRMPIKFFANLENAFDYFNTENISVYAAVIDRSALKLTDIKFNEKSAVAIGNEGNGLSSKFLEMCSKHIFIPMTGITESLNASAAASVLIWEMCK